jgi:hypothetical protein
LTRRPRGHSRLGIHPPFEVDHTAHRGRQLDDWNRTGVLLEHVQKHDEVVGSLIENSIARISEANP